jgi:hypothetical protein
MNSYDYTIEQFKFQIFFILREELVICFKNQIHQH